MVWSGNLGNFFQKASSWPSTKSWTMLPCPELWGLPVCLAGGPRVWFSVWAPGHALSSQLVCIRATPSYEFQSEPTNLVVKSSGFVLEDCSDLLHTWHFRINFRIRLSIYQKKKKSCWGFYWDCTELQMHFQIIGILSILVLTVLCMGYLILYRRSSLTSFRNVSGVQCSVVYTFH